METVYVGGLNFSSIGLGTFTMKGELLKKSLDCAINNGYTLIDTAFKYQNESEIGCFLSNIESQKNQIIVQTKFSATQLTSKKFLWLKYGRTTTEDAIKGSLKRLQKQCLDVYLLHSPSNGFEEYYGDLMKFREQGKVKVIGVCRFDESQLQKIREVCGEYPTINQIEIHPFHTNKKVINFCKENGITVEARSLFAHGDIMEELLQSDILKSIAKEYNKSIQQIVIRWVVQQGLVAVVKSGSQSHIKENIDVFDFSLTEKQMLMIDSMNRDQSFGFVSSKLKVSH